MGVAQSRRLTEDTVRTKVGTGAGAAKPALVTVAPAKGKDASPPAEKKAVLKGGEVHWGPAVDLAVDRVRCFFPPRDLRRAASTVTIPTTTTPAVAEVDERVKAFLGSLAWIDGKIMGACEPSVATAMSVKLPDIVLVHFDGDAFRVSRVWGVGAGMLGGWSGCPLKLAPPTTDMIDVVLCWIMRVGGQHVCEVTRPGAAQVKTDSAMLNTRRVIRAPRMHLLQMAYNGNARLILSIPMRDNANRQEVIAREVFKDPVSGPEKSLTLWAGCNELAAFDDELTDPTAERQRATTKTNVVHEAKRRVVNQILSLSRSGIIGFVEEMVKKQMDDDAVRQEKQKQALNDAFATITAGDELSVPGSTARPAVTTTTTTRAAYTVDTKHQSSKADTGVTPLLKSAEAPAKTSTPAPVLAADPSQLKLTAEEERVLAKARDVERAHTLVKTQALAKVEAKKQAEAKAKRTKLTDVEKLALDSLVTLTPEEERVLAKADVAEKAHAIAKAQALAKVDAKKRAEAKVAAKTNDLTPAEAEAMNTDLTPDDEKALRTTAAEELYAEERKARLTADELATYATATAKNEWAALDKARREKAEREERQKAVARGELVAVTVDDYVSPITAAAGTNLALAACLRTTADEVDLVRAPPSASMLDGGANGELVVTAWRKQGSYNDLRAFWTTYLGKQERPHDTSAIPFARGLVALNGARLVHTPGGRPRLFHAHYTVETGVWATCVLDVVESWRVRGVAVCRGRAYLGLDVDDYPFLLILSADGPGKHRLVRAREAHMSMPKLMAFLPEPYAAKRWSVRTPVMPSAPAKKDGGAAATAAGVRPSAPPPTPPDNRESTRVALVHADGRVRMAKIILPET